MSNNQEVMYKLLEEVREWNKLWDKNPFPSPHIMNIEEFSKDLISRYDIKQKDADQSQQLMDFGGAIKAIKEGKKVARLGWNGKSMWIALGKGNPALAAEGFWNPHTKAFAESNGGFAEVLPYILFKTADGKILMGWLASQTDILSEDWTIVQD